MPPTSSAKAPTAHSTPTSQTWLATIQQLFIESRNCDVILRVSIEQPTVKPLQTDDSVAKGHEAKQPLQDVQQQQQHQQEPQPQQEEEEEQQQQQQQQHKHQHQHQQQEKPPQEQPQQQQQQEEQQQQQQKQQTQHQRQHTVDIPCHSLVLIAHSGYFEAALSGVYIENQ